MAHTRKGNNGNMNEFPQKSRFDNVLEPKEKNIWIQFDQNSPKMDHPLSKYVFIYFQGALDGVNPTTQRSTTMTEHIYLQDQMHLLFNNTNRCLY